MLKLKINLIKDSKSQIKQKDLAAKYGIGTSTVSDILKKKGEILQEYGNNANEEKCRFGTSCKYNELNELTWKWFSQARVKSILISGPIIKEKATKFASTLFFVQV